MGTEQQSEDLDEKVDTFSELVDSLDAGQASVELNRTLRALVAELEDVAEDSGRAEGSITLKVKFKTAGKSGQTEITYEVNGKRPVRTRGKTTLFARADGTLTDSDARQPKLPIKGAAGVRRAIKDLKKAGLESISVTTDGVTKTVKLDGTKEND